MNNEKDIAMTDNMTLQQLLEKGVANYVQSERPQELIAKGIDKLFVDVVDDAFRSYGAFGKAIKAAVAEALPANIEDMFEMTRYNAVVAEALRQRWHSAAVSESLLKAANSAIDEVLSDEFIQGEVSLRSILGEFIAAHEEFAAEQQIEEPDIRFAQEDNSLHIYFDKEVDSRKSNYRLAHAIHIHLEKSNSTGNSAHGRVYAAKLDDKNIGVKMRIYSKWERMIASLYYGNAKIVIDCDEDDFSYQWNN